LLQRTTNDRDGETFSLLPSVMAIANIRIGRRSTVSYLVSPFRKKVSDAARER
jgi:hypothetical protein